MKKFAVLSIILTVCSTAAFSADKSELCGAAASLKKDYQTKNADYIYDIKKQEEKDRYKKQKMDRNASGFMTVEEYEKLSAPKDKTIIETEIPKVQKGSDMKYVPQPTYKIVRYNNPPGSPELSINKNFYKQRQLNAQGITSPDYSMMVYPAVYYYPENAGVASDLFVVPLKENDTPLNKIMKANIMHRNPVPILSTDKSINVDYSFRTLTPIDFSYDSTKLLVKEKIGYSADGIWQTNAIVYDFETKTSYNLSELRAAIVYYWKDRKGVDLDDKRWDIYPMGFQLLSPYRVVAAAYAYTGDMPVFLGIWSVDSKGEQTRLESLTEKDIPVSMNGFKIIKDGAIVPSILKLEEKQVKRFEKAEEKRKKAEDKAEVKKMTDEHKANMKELREQFNDEKREYRYQNRIQGTTTQNDAVEQYRDEKAIRDLKEEQKEDAQKLKELEKEERLLNKESAEQN